MKEFIATRWAGYYWNTRTKTLFSTKRKKIVELKRVSYRDYRKGVVEGYSIYNNGKSQFVALSSLCNLTGTLVDIYAARGHFEEELFTI